MRCGSCGHDNPPKVRFCANCGSKLATTVKKSALVVAPGAESGVPEAEVEYMGFWIRFAAVIIDLLVLSAIASIVLITIAILMPTITTLLIIFIFIALPLLYYWLLTGLKGQTVGKMAVGIKVVNATGSVPGLRRAALREIPGKIISTIPVFQGFFWRTSASADMYNQCWHDEIANTYVVSTRARRQQKQKGPPI
jgi:uncharacterized RDD family membrane protein YckC